MRLAFVLPFAVACGRTYDVEVDHHQVDCRTESSSISLDLREEGEDWHCAPLGVRDFDYTWGYTYGLTIHRTPRPSRAADAIPYRLDLVEELWSEPAEPGETFSLSVEGYDEQNFDWIDMEILAHDPKAFTCGDWCDTLNGSFGGYTTATFAFGDPIEGPVEVVDVR